MPFKKLPRLLLRWFRHNQRPLAWRRTNDPYRIWISEIMLQQTQVKTVLPYYERWMKAFPALRALAKSPLAKVLKLWEGLGYYSRARNLHRTSQIVLQQWKGELPASREELQKLPGIGRYTAGAIASIAFNQPEPILDGNVKRVLSRIFAVKQAVDTPAGEKKLWGIAAVLVRTSGDPGNFNQSLMELGALVCLPDHPKCGICPVRKLCKAHRLKRELDFPIKARREKMEKLKTLAAVIWKKGRVLIERQPLESRWGGLWMFPQWKANGRAENEYLKEKVKEELGIGVDEFQPRIEIKHGFTKYRVCLRAYEGNVGAGLVPARHRAPTRGAPTNGRTTRWIRPTHLRRFPLPAPHQKIAEAIQNHA